MGKKCQLKHSEALCQGEGTGDVMIGWEVLEDFKTNISINYLVQNPSLLCSILHLLPNWFPQLQSLPGHICPLQYCKVHLPGITLSSHFSLLNKLSVVSKEKNRSKNLTGFQNYFRCSLISQALTLRSAKVSELSHRTYLFHQGSVFSWGKSLTWYIPQFRVF